MAIVFYVLLNYRLIGYFQLCPNYSQYCLFPKPVMMDNALICHFKASFVSLLMLHFLWPYLYMLPDWQKVFLFRINTLLIPICIYVSEILYSSSSKSGNNHQLRIGEGQYWDFMSHVDLHKCQCSINRSPSFHHHVC